MFSLREDAESLACTVTNLGCNQRKIMSGLPGITLIGIVFVYDASGDTNVDSNSADGLKS